MKAFIRLVPFTLCLLAVGTGSPARTQTVTNDPLADRVAALEQRLDVFANEHTAMMAKIDLLVEKLDKLVDPLVQAPRRSTESRDSVAAPARFTYKVLTNGSVVACDENGCQVVTGYSAGLFGRQYGYAECVTCDTQSMAVEFRQGPVRRGLFGRRR